MAKKVLWILFAFMAITIGLYPIIYFVIDRKFGLLSSKDGDLLINVYWNIGFYVHIIFGGLALLVGWIQFSEKIRATKLKLHRQIGKVYVIASLLSGAASLFIAYFATGGLISALGFAFLGMTWLYTTLQAFLSIKKGDIIAHQRLMIYSYACCFAAVTLRIWLPILINIFRDFTPAYQIVAWLCWIPNLIIAFFIIKRIEHKKIRSTAPTSK